MYTQKNIKDTESLLKHQLGATFDKSASENKVNPRDYFVPDFGLDQDIIGVNDGLAFAEKDLGKKWTPVYNGKYWENMPAAAANSSYVYGTTSKEDSEVTRTPN